MTTQEEKNESRKQLLRLVSDLLEEENNIDMNFLSAQNLTKQAFFKYLDLKDCPFRDQCREDAYENEPEPIDVRGELD